MECPRGKWQPPYCESDCPVCYNGGVCSVHFGACICPPGFTGNNCEEACGHNNWGRDCNIICSSKNKGNCKGSLYCLPDPFGCSCMSGYGDLDCKRVCDTETTGKYGPGCLLDCHCDASDCQPSEGCNETANCHTGYTGTRCLERKTDVECPDGFYGPQCTKICHCRSSSKCDRNSGNCHDGDVCEDGWAGLGCQQVLPALSDAPLVAMFLNTCNVEISWSIWSLDNDYGRGNVHSYQLEYWPTSHITDLVVLYTTMDTEMNISRTQMNNNTEYSFTVKVVTDVEGVLVVGKPSPLAVQIYLSDLPALSNAPLIEVFANYFNISWSVWNFYKDYGCGNVDSYRFEFWPTNDTSDLVVLNVTIGTETSITCANMNYNTEYSFTVKVLTEVDGVLLVGKPSPLAFHQIYPPVLQNPPSVTSRSSLGINITWTEWAFNRDDGIGCVTGYVVEWWDAVEAWNISNNTFNGEPSEGILIPDIPYYTTLVLQIKTLYNKRSNEVIGLPSPLLVIFREQCPYGWKQFKETCYLFGDNVINCDDANSFCQRESAKLVSITSQEEKKFVSSQAGNISHEHCWIGLESLTWDWNWTPDGEGKCTQFYPTSVSWSDGPCEISNQTRAVCKKDIQKFGCLDGSWYGYKNNCYRHYSNLSWPAAVSFCRGLRKADLASIHSQEEDEFIQTIIQYYDGDSWIGLNFSDEEHWSDGTDVDYSVIETGAEGGCVVYRREDHVFSWKTQSCASSERAYVCKDMRGNISVLSVEY
ncbi:uncharacterized protein LOC117117283 [Anneissia japonica]|uniref:uncharacterized protein LOC117117283 n=1 Tax=Anneissia japonica TaxID=1529436 RepID=UPI0014254C6C|nr:uncharacterized protein LOC117117283 [Anneissia japonica]